MTNHSTYSKSFTEKAQNRLSKLKREIKDIRDTIYFVKNDVKLNTKIDDYIDRVSQAQAGYEVSNFKSKEGVTIHCSIRSSDYGNIHCTNIKFLFEDTPSGKLCQKLLFSDWYALPFDFRNGIIDEIENAAPHLKSLASTFNQLKSTKHVDINHICMLIREKSRKLQPIHIDCSKQNLDEMTR